MNNSLLFSIIAIILSITGFITIVKPLNTTTTIAPPIDNVAHQSVTTQSNTTIPTSKNYVAKISSKCGLDIQISGGTFDPDSCVIKIISSGVNCDPRDDRDGVCPPETTYEMDLIDSNKTHIRSLYFYINKELGDGIYTFNNDLKDFNGYVLDNSATVRNLKNGILNITKWDTTATISFEASFANNITINAGGEILINREAAP